MNNAHMKKTSAALFLAILFILWPAAVSAVEEHVDPATVVNVYSGVSLLHYYSNSLDMVIQKDPAGTEELLAAMPFAHVNEAITTQTQEFVQSATAIAQAVPEIDKLLTKRDEFIADSRLTDAAATSSEISSDIEQALVEVDSLQEATVLTGNVLNVSASSPQSDLAATYAEVLSKINRIRAMLTLSQNLVSAQNSSIDDLNSLQPTSLALTITPQSAFVGDTVHFEAALTNNNRPLGGRVVSILLDGSLFATATTGADGRCSGDFALPFWYISQVEARALYTPQGNDTGVLLGSLSPATMINLSFYSLSLSGSARDGYPGLSETVNAALDYGTWPPLENRRFSIYLDDTLLNEINSGGGFSDWFTMDPDTSLGPHLITISSPSEARYAPALTSFSINVKKGTVTLILNKPGAVFIPGTINFSGRAYTELGPLKNGQITIALGGSKVGVTTADDGGFTAKLKAGLGLSLIGSQSVSVQISPSEPWNAPLSESQSLFAVNYLNCVGAAAALAFFGIYMPKRLGARAGAKKQTDKIVEDFIMDLPSSGTVTVTDKQTFRVTPRNPAQEKILYWYTRVLKFVQKMAGLSPRPQQTMREFARESGPSLGPISSFFLEITLIAERSLYSSCKPSQSEVDKSRELSQAINPAGSDETV